VLTGFEEWKGRCYVAPVCCRILRRKLSSSARRLSISLECMGNPMIGLLAAEDAFKIVLNRAAILSSE
jgi:hypothetical protein